MPDTDEYLPYLYSTYLRYQAQTACYRLLPPVTACFPRLAFSTVGQCHVADLSVRLPVPLRRRTHRTAQCTLCASVVRTRRRYVDSRYRRPFVAAHAASPTGWSPWCRHFGWE